jgi:hypothetical protein
MSSPPPPCSPPTKLTTSLALLLSNSPGCLPTPSQTKGSELPSSPIQVLYAVLREYHFVTRGLNHLLYDLNRHRTERNALYHSLMSSVQFQQMLEPILWDFRRRQRTNDPSPLVIPTILPPSTTTSSPQSVPIASLPQSTTPIDDPPTSASPSGSNRSFLSYYTASQEELGTPTHPIDVDLLPDQQVTTTYEEMGTQTNPIDVDRFDFPSPRTNTVRKTHSAPLIGYCTICNRNGHPTARCLRRIEPCDYCKEIGHHQTECPTYNRDLLRYNPNLKRCHLCNAPGHETEQCNLLPFSQ